MRNYPPPRFCWKGLMGNVGVAEWAWTESYPPEATLAELWFKPFMMLEKEATW
ncbi:MAG: hypothetical protein GY771_15060 [bacterium]|nr:hypothetical protein [bacterium]